MRRYPAPTPLAQIALPPRITDEQAAAALILDFTAAASRGDVDALAWVMSSRLQGCAALAGVDAQRVRRTTVEQFLEAPDELTAEEQLAADEAALRAELAARPAAEAARAAGVTRAHFCMVRDIGESPWTAAIAWQGLTRADGSLRPACEAIRAAQRAAEVAA